MKKKTVVAFLMAMAITAGMSNQVITSKAAGLTQATSADVVNYGSLSSADTEIIKSMFDFEFYKSQNPDLLNVLGDDYDMFFKHFCLCGIFEGRTCNANFDPAAYASAYDDLKEMFGSDIIKYYEHYAAFGSKENRTLTNVEACANAGITVQGIVDTEVKITPQAYKIAVRLGTTDFKTVQAAVDKAVSAAADSSNNSGSSSNSTPTIVATTEAIDPVYAKAQGLESAGTIKVEKDLDSKGNVHGRTELHIYIAKGNVGYGAYRGSESLNIADNSTKENAEFVYGTEGYEASSDLANSFISGIDLYVRTNDYPNKGESIETLHKDGNELKVKYVMERIGDVPDKGAQILSVDRITSNVTTTDNDFEATKVNTYEQVQTLYDINTGKELTAEDRDGYSGVSAGAFKEKVAVDEDATVDTEYNVGVSIKVNEDKITTSVGLSNKDDNFGYITTYEFKDNTNN